MKISEVKKLEKGDILIPLYGRKSSYQVPLVGMRNVRFDSLEYEVTSNYCCIRIIYDTDGNKNVNDVVYSNAFKASNSFNDSYKIF
jgi:hypothetical protein